MQKENKNYYKMLKNGSLHLKYICFKKKTLEGSCISTFIFYRSFVFKILLI